MPSAGRVDEALVFRTAPVGDGGWLRPAEPLLRQEAAAQRSVGEQPYTLLAAQRRERAGGAPIHQGERNLVVDDRDAVGQRQGEMRGVEVRDADRADQSILL